MVENTKKRRNVSNMRKSEIKSKDANNIQNKKENAKNEKSINFKYIIKDYFKFYKQKLMRKHIIIYIICLIVFFVIVASRISFVDFISSCFP